MMSKGWLAGGAMIVVLAGTAMNVRGQEAEGLDPDFAPGIEAQGPEGPAQGEIAMGGPMAPRGVPGPGGARGMRGGAGGFRFGPHPAGGPMGRVPEEARERLAQLAQLRRQVDESARKYRDAEAKEKDSIKETLRKALSELFDAELSEKERRAKTLEKELARLKESASKGKANKDKIVARRLEALTEGWGW